MSKKIVIPVVAALVLTLIAGLVVSSHVLAQGAGPLGRWLRARPVLGQVTLIGKAEFTVKTKDGTEQTFTVDDSTRYRSKDKAELTFADLKTGQWVAVVTGRGQGASNLARFVVTLPEGLDPTQFEGARGKVSAVNPAASQFTLENQQGEKTVVTVDAETVYRGEASSLADLQEGMLAGVISKEMAGDGLVARIVRAGDPIGVHFGEISEVNTSAGTITLKTQRTSQELTVSVDESTRFRSKSNEIAGLRDLKTGMVAMVVTKTPAGEEQTDAPLKAVLVAAGDKSDLPKADLRVGGRVVSLDQNAFTIEDRDGKQYTFQTTGDTRIRGREINSFADLKTGMLALVGAKDLGNGPYQAQVVLALPRR
jgi:hypothetical protein